MKSYERAFRYRTQLPTKALFYATRVLSTKKFAADVRELRDGVEQVRIANETFSFFLLKDWVFDSASCQKLDAFLKASSAPGEHASFPVNVKQIQWEPFAQNHAYGVKHYVLKEEAVLPSLGFGDSLVPIKSFGFADWAPWSKKVSWNMNVRLTADMERLVLETDSVKEAIAEIVATKLAYYKNTLQLDVDEHKIYQEVRKAASTSLNVIMANY